MTLIFPASLPEEAAARLNWSKGRHDAQITLVLNPWWRYILGKDNKNILISVKCPVLAIYGDLDQQASPDKNIPVIETA